MNLRQGTLLKHGEYSIERVLGQGGFGITYLATQVGLNRKVAIKEFFMREYCNRDTDTSHVTVGSEGSRDVVEKFRSKFVKEAQNIACLKHPHIISIYDVFEENGTAYYVMEYLDRGSLAELVKQRGRLSEADALRYIRQIADALRYIHARKMNHLDVKPANILIDDTDGAVLIDFGLSKHYDDEGNQTSTTPVGISHGYAPLEQYKKGGVGTFSPSTDIYSLGATLYKLVTGDTPPDANDINDDGFPAFPSYVSASVAHAIEQAMQPRRKDRPQTIEAFLVLLKAEVKVEDECTVLDEDLSASLVTPSSRPSINRGTVGGASFHPEGKHQQAPPLFIEGVSSGRGSSKRSAEQTPIWKKLLLPALACIAVLLAVVFWSKSGGIPVYSEEIVESVVTEEMILPPSGRQNDTNQHQTVQVGSKIDSTHYFSIVHEMPLLELSQQQSQPAEPVKDTDILTTTLLYVTTTPSGVTVYIDGNKVGTTPIEDKEISRGSHKVKLCKDGYQDKTFTRTFGDKPVVLNETLTEKPKPQPATGTINGHEWVDLGLSVKWATCNIGASSPSDYGGYYAWGETNTKSNYTEDTYKYYKNGEYVDVGDNISNTKYDAVRANWGNTWRIPTIEEFLELKEKCTWEWIIQDGRKGYRVTGPNKKCIFLPSAGYRHSTNLNSGDSGYYWAATSIKGNLARVCCFNADSYRWGYELNRFLGLSVRPVTD